MHLRHVDAQWALSSGWRCRIECALWSQDTPIALPQNASKELAEAGHCIDALTQACGVGHLHRGHLARKVRRRNSQDAFAQHSLVGGNSLVDRNIESSGLLPGMEH